MDANRNEKNYLRIENKIVDNFLDDQKWRKDWLNSKSKKFRFGDFIVLKFNERMCSLNYLCLEKDEFVLIRGLKNKPLYHLAFYSRDSLGKHIWNEARRGCNNQLTLFNDF